MTLQNQPEKNERKDKINKLFQGVKALEELAGELGCAIFVMEKDFKGYEALMDLIVRIKAGKLYDSDKNQIT